MEQGREATDKNRKRGMRCQTSRLVTVESRSIQGTGCRSRGLCVEG